MKNTTIYVVGDSTLSAFADSYYLPRYGYGTKLAEYLVPQAKVVNLALSGRSSRSFLSEENYGILQRSIGEGDFLVIGFGHNDEKGEEERYTDPNLVTDGEDRSFRHILYSKYVCLARSRGAVPLLCTPIVRLSEGGDYSGPCGHITQPNGKYAGGNYAEAIRALGRERGVTVIDLTAATKALYERLGFERASDFHAWAATDKGKRAGLDQTHLNAYGALRVAYLWAQALQESDCPLRAYLKSPLTEPTREKYFAAINAAYAEPGYRPFDASSGGSCCFHVDAPWYAAVMGDFGGKEHVGEFIVRQTAHGVEVGNAGTVPRGKISRATDGFAAVFRQIGINSNFTARARATVKRMNACDGQTGFGMMLRDDIYIDEYRAALNSNYVAAGVVGNSALFFREGGKLTVEVNAVRLAEGAQFDLYINKVNQQITIAVDGDEKTFYDFDLAAVDNGSCYLCLFANRGVVVEFTDLSFEQTGDSVRA